MSGNYLLDSNIIIDLFRGDIATIEKLQKVKKVYVPVIVLGELYYGANKSNRTKQRTLEVESLERKVIILDCTNKTAKLYGEIKDQLRQKGAMIPENDIWIAAISKENKIKLATRDNHFDRVEGLDIEKW